MKLPKKVRNHTDSVALEIDRTHRTNKYDKYFREWLKFYINFRRKMRKTTVPFLAFVESD